VPKIRAEYKVAKLEMVVDKPGEARESVHIEGANSPPVRGPSVVKRTVTAQRVDGDEAGQAGGETFDASGTPAEIPTGAVPDKRYLPASFLEKGVIRKKLYERGADWDLVRFEQNINNIDLMMPGIDVLQGHPWEETRAQVEAWVNANKLPPEALDAVDQRRFGMRWVRQWMATDALKYKNAYHIDHIESLAKHWVNQGHDASDADRIQHATDPENLNWISARANLSKSSVDEDGESYHFTDVKYVAPEFTSSLAEGGKKGAFTIGGEPFKDETGKPLKKP
jgi:hypothetical protein